MRVKMTSLGCSIRTEIEAPLLAKLDVTPKYKLTNYIESLLRFFCCAGRPFVFMSCMALRLYLRFMMCGTVTLFHGLVLEVDDDVLGAPRLLIARNRLLFFRLVSLSEISCLL